MNTFNRPMLACSLLKPDEPHTDEVILEKMKGLRYPVIVTLKKDGIRAIKLGDLASRTLKKIPNISISKRAEWLPYGLDMELWTPDLPYDQIESIVMSKVHQDQDKIQFHVLDWWQGNNYSYVNRLFLIEEAVMCKLPNLCVELPFYFHCGNALQLFNAFKRVEEVEGEGICFRVPDSPYKQGRSTLKEQYLIKLARFTRDEAVIIGFEEQLLNTNASKTDFVGLTKRSSCQEGMVGKGVLGAFVVRYKNGLEGRIGTGVGLTDKKRAEIWDRREEWLNKTIVYKSKGHGVKTKPRSPVFIGKRNEVEL